MIPPNPLLRQLRDLDKTSPQFHEQLNNFLRGNEYRNVFPNLQSEDLAWLVEYLDNVLVGISDPASVAFQEYLHELRKLCGVKEVLPKSCTLSDSLLDISLPSASGCVHEGVLDGSKVRIRRVGLCPESDPQKAKEIFHQVAITWKHLAHPNVVPLLGVTTHSLQVISDWMSGGDLTEYIMNHPVADRLSLLSDVAGGLSYLHSCNVIHGDLKGTSILVDATGRARVTDFGLAMIAQNLYSIRSSSAEHGDSARWIAPEILGDRGSYSKEADVFSFAMVMIEAFTGAVPFSDKPPRMAMFAIVGGERPPRPTHPTLTDGLWALVQRCWDQAAHLRPGALEILCGLGIPAWKRSIICPRAIDERISLITAIFSDRIESEAVRRLSGDDARSFVDVIDKTLDDLPPRLRKKCLSTLCKICGRQGLLPKSLQIPLCYDRSDNALYNGGYADVWMGEYQGRKVAVKVLRVYSTSNLDKIIRRFCKEVLTWKNLRHTNVLPLLGVTMSKSHFAMVSEWMVNGNINEFIKAHRDVNRFELLEDVARGLIYMHGEGMIHGDLKGANILIDQNDHACLADFGLLTIVSESTYPTTSSSSTNAGTTRWMSPELLDPDRFGSEDGRPTKESDCYALGMVILEVLSGETPFPRDNGLVVMRKIIEGGRPERSQGAGGVWFTDDLWEKLEQCWSPQPKDRPTVRAMLECVERSSAAWQPLPPGSDDEIQSDSDDESNSTVSYHQSTPQSPVESRRSTSPVLHPVQTVFTPIAPQPQASAAPHQHSPHLLPGIAASLRGTTYEIATGQAVSVRSTLPPVHHPRPMGSDRSDSFSAPPRKNRKSVPRSAEASLTEQPHNIEHVSAIENSIPDAGVAEQVNSSAPPNTPEERVPGRWGFKNMPLPTLPGVVSAWFSNLIDDAESVLFELCMPAPAAGYEHGDRRGCLAGTREAILDEVKAWMNGSTRGSEDSAIFWLNGLAGTGKTAIAQTVAERMFAESVLGASFFCSGSFGDRNNTYLIFPTLAYQLARKDKNFRSALVALLRSDPSIPFQRPLERQMRKLIVEPFRSTLTTNPVFIVIDGLDKCKDDEPESSFLLVLGKLLPEIPGIKFFITSRPERHVMSGIRAPLLEGLTKTFVLHRVDHRTVDNDIRRFFKHELLGIAQRDGSTDVWPSDEHLDSLSRRAGGLFIYAVATVNFLQHESKSPSDQLDTIMKSPENTIYEGKAKLRAYTNLDSLYTSIFQAAFLGNDADDDAMVRSTLSAVVLTANPLSVSVIATLMDSHYDQVWHLLELIQSLIVLPEDPSDPIQPFHKSFPDFITDPGRCIDKRFYISPNYHTQLVLRCLEIMGKSLEKNMCSIPDYSLNSEVKDLSKRLEDSGIRGALEYACTSWYKHLTPTKDQIGDVICALCHLLEEKFLFWLEVSSVLGVVGDAARALGETIRWLGKVRETTEIGRLLHTAKDCLRFVTEFFEVTSLSAPHIYHSALALVPRSSMVWELYNQHSPSPGPRVVTGFPGSLDSCTASTMVPTGRCDPTWSKCGQFIAVSRGGAVGILNSIYLESVVTLGPPRSHTDRSPWALTFSPNGSLLACVYSSDVNSPLRTKIIVWDTRTGIVVKNLYMFQGEPFVRIEYSGDGGAIIAIQENQAFSIYDGRNYERLSSGSLRPSHRHFPGTLWVRGESIRFSTGLTTGQQLTINIHEVLPTSIPPVVDVESLPVLFRHGKLFFSPARFHASFVTETEVIIIDARNSEVLFQTKAPKPLYKPQGCFSPDGRFFVCETLAQEICIWENTPTGYDPRDRLRPRSVFRNFMFSPTATSILCWDQETIQLLDPDVRVSSPLPRESVSRHHHGGHVAAHSASGDHTAIAWRGRSAVTLFDPCLDAPRRFLDTGMEIQDIKIVGDTLFVADTRQLASWRLGVRRETIVETVVLDTGVGDVHRLVLSKDCSRIFLVTSGSETQDFSRSLFVRDVKTGSILAESTIEFDVDGIGFFPDGCRVWFAEKREDAVRDDGPHSHGDWVWKIGKDEGSVTSAPERVDKWPADCPWMPPAEYSVGDGNQWVIDSRSKLPLLWLPPTWRTGREWDRRWDGNLLTVLGDRPEPVIIELPSPSLPIHSPDI